MICSFFDSSGQNNILPASNPDIVISNLPFDTNGHHFINCDMNNDGSNYLVAVILDDLSPTVGNQITDQLELVLYNGTISNNFTITPSNLIMGFQPGTSTPYASPTELKNPDIVVLNNGAKLIITFDTDNSTYGACWAEYDINPVTLSVTQNTSFFGGAIPVSHFYSNNVQYSKSPRIDRTFDYSTALEMCAIIATQDIYNNGNMTPVITYLYDNLGLYFQTNPTTTSMPVLSSGQANFYSPDIAVTFNSNSGTIQCATSFIQQAGTYQWAVHEYQFEFGVASNNYYTNLVNTTQPIQIPNFEYIHPRICCPPHFSFGMPNEPVPFSLCYTNAMDATFGVNIPHLYYTHFDNYNLVSFNPDAQNSYGWSRNGEPAVEYMKTTNNNTNREACMVWPTYILANGSGTNEYPICALMDPFINSTFYDWSQVNTNIITNTLNVRYGTAIAATWENAWDMYVIAWVANQEVNLKIRPIHITDYKPLAIEEAQKYRVYPNPAKDFIIIDAPMNTSFQIYNGLGVCVKNGMTKESKFKMSTNEFAQGNYYLRINNQEISFTITH